MCSKLLHIFYQSDVASAIFFAAICRGSSISAGVSKKLNKLIKKDVCMLVDCSGAPTVGCGELHKLFIITDNTTHHLHNLLVGQQSLQSEAQVPVKEVIPAHRNTNLQ